MEIKSYKDLEVWNKSIELTKNIYQATKDFPKEEIYGLTSQIRRSTVSIPSNIAEGKGRHHLSEYIHFLYIASGSCAELETQVIIAMELAYLPKEKAKRLLETIDHVGRMLHNLASALEKQVR